MAGIEYLLAGLIGMLAGGMAVWSWCWSRAEDALANAGVECDRDNDVVARELERGRRYERPFVIVRLPDESFDTPGAPSQEAVAAVTGSLRTIDFSWVDDAGMHILLPEARRSEGEACIRRLVEVAPSLAKADAQLAVFPDDGVTRGALFSRLSGSADVLPAPDDLPTPGDLPTPEDLPTPDVPSATDLPDDVTTLPRWAS